MYWTKPGPVSAVGVSYPNRRVSGTNFEFRGIESSGATRAATVLDGHRGQVTIVAFSLDGKRVVTGSDDDSTAWV
jgi:hypothetical protein